MGPMRTIGAGGDNEKAVWLEPTRQLYPLPAVVSWNLSFAQCMLLSCAVPCTVCVLGAQLCSTLWAEGGRSLILISYFPLDLNYSSVK